MQENTKLLLELIRPWLADEASFGRLHADIHDLTDICQRFLQVVGSDSARKYSHDEIEGFLIDLDIEIDHSLFHLKSAKKEIALALDKLAEAEGDAMERHGVG